MDKKIETLVQNINKNIQKLKELKEFEELSEKIDEEESVALARRIHEREESVALARRLQEKEMSEALARRMMAGDEQAQRERRGEALEGDPDPPTPLERVVGMGFEPAAAAAALAACGDDPERAIARLLDPQEGARAGVEGRLEPGAPAGLEFKVVNVPGDGACLFRAILLSENAGYEELPEKFPGGSSRYHSAFTLRDASINFNLRNWNKAMSREGGTLGDIIKLIHAYDLKKVRKNKGAMADKKAYEQALIQPKVFGDEPEITAACNIITKRIVVYRSYNLDQPPTVHNPEGPEGESLQQLDQINAALASQPGKKMLLQLKADTVQGMHFGNRGGNDVIRILHNGGHYLAIINKSSLKEWEATPEAVNNAVKTAVKKWHGYKPAPAPDKAKVARLVELGFPKESCEAALLAAGGVYSAAVAALLPAT